MNVLYNELDAFPAQWLRNLVAAGHLPMGHVDARSIADLGPTDCQPTSHFFAGVGGWPLAVRLAGWPDELPVWTGSCPCQPFSAAGKHGGTDDPRHLWPEWFRLIREGRPPVIFGEQVASRDGLAWLDIVQADLAGEGYAIGALDLCAAGFGAPHIRQRLYFVAESERRGRERSHIPVRQPRQIEAETIERGPVGRLANADGGNSGAEGLQRGGEYRQWEEDGRARELGDVYGERSRGQRPNDDAQGRSHSERQAGLSDGTIRATNGFWADAEWFPCTDGKTRPIGPGLFPLAHGVPSRVGRLRAYGNALVIPQAVEFVRAYMDIMPDETGERS